MPVIGQATHKQPELLSMTAVPRTLKALSDAERAGQFFIFEVNGMRLSIVGNLLSLAGCLLMVGIGLMKKKKQILAAQCLQFTLMGLGNLALGAVSGCISNLVGILRNAAFCKWQVTVPWKLGFIAVQALLSLGTLSQGAMEWLPVIAAATYTWFLDTKSEVTLKAVMLGAQVMWLVYDLHYGNYTAAVFDVLTMGSTLAGILRLRAARNASHITPKG